MAKRPIRVANCSGAMCKHPKLVEICSNHPLHILNDEQLLTIYNIGDPGEHMLTQAKYGPVDVITGDYLAGTCLIIPETFLKQPSTGLY